jgi:hypothetical protein
MDKIANPLRAIGELLAGRAQPVVTPERLAASAIYDLQYRMAVIASAFEMHSKPHGVSQRRIHAARLKLLQFIACRPRLLAVLRDWSQAQHDAQLSIATSQRLRRGFLGDQMHEDVVTFLVARGILVWSGSHVATGPGSDWLTQLHSATIEQGIFAMERDVLEELLDVRITNAMLEGW